MSNTSQLQFDQEFGNTFFGTGDTLINSDTLLDLRSKPPIQVLEGGDVKVYEETKKDHEYLMTVDVARGRGQDYSTFNVIDITVRPFKQVAVYRNNTISPILFPDIIYKFAKVYNNAYVIIESNDQGSIVCRGLYYDLEYENVHVESAIKSNAVGIEMTRKSKRLGAVRVLKICSKKGNSIFVMKTQYLRYLPLFRKDNHTKRVMVTMMT